MTREQKGAAFLVVVLILVSGFIVGYLSAKVRYEPACSELKPLVERTCK